MIIFSKILIYTFSPIHVGPVQFVQVIPLSDTSVTITWHAPDTTLTLSYRVVVSQWEDDQVIERTSIAAGAPLVWTVSNLRAFLITSQL